MLGVSYPRRLGVIRLSKSSMFVTGKLCNTNIRSYAEDRGILSRLLLMHYLGKSNFLSWCMSSQYAFSASASLPR